MVLGHLTPEHYMISKIRQLFTTRKPRISAPMVKSTGVIQSKAIGRGYDIMNIPDRIERVSQGHADAVEAATINAIRTRARSPMLQSLAFENVHLTHIVFAPGTGRDVLKSKLPIGIKGTQLGAACVRGKNGHLHVYALVHIGGQKPAKKVRFAFA